MGKKIVLILILTLVNAFLAGSEMAFISLKPTRIQKMIKEESKAAKRVDQLLGNTDRFLSTIQVGITIAGFLNSASASQAFVSRLAPYLSFTPFASTLATILITLGIAYVTLVLGELYPKSVAMHMPEKYACMASLPILILQKIFYPFVLLLDGSVGLLKKISPIDFEKEDKGLTRTEVRALLFSGRNDGVIDAKEYEMLEGVLSLDSKQAREIMIARNETVMIGDSRQWQEFIEGKIKRYSRLPFYEGSRDNIIGILHVKDLLFDEQLSYEEAKDKLKEPLFVSEMISTSALLLHFKRKKQHLAILVDEYGGFVGIVTLEDLLEEIVGEIDDEFDAPNPRIKRLGKNSYLVDARIELDALNKSLQTNLQSDEVNTLAGLILERLDHMPKLDEKINMNGITVIVQEVENQKIRRVKIVQDNQ